MADGLLFSTIVGLILGVLFLVLELTYDPDCVQCSEAKRGQRKRSLIAGATVVYFFFQLLPELVTIEGAFLNDLAFIGILAGFVFIHVTEKLILQRVDVKSRNKIDELLSEEQQLESRDDKLDHLIQREIIENSCDTEKLRALANELSLVEGQEQSIHQRHEEIKTKVEQHLNEDWTNLHSITSYLYHFLIGLTLVNLLTFDFIGAFLFFLIAVLQTMLSSSSCRHYHITLGGSQICLLTRSSGNPRERGFLGSSLLQGVIVGLLFELFFTPSVFITGILLAFVSGYILYITVREVIPEKDQGNPFYFLLGVVSFGFFIYALGLVEVLLPLVLI